MRTIKDPTFNIYRDGGNVERKGKEINREEDNDHEQNRGNTISSVPTSKKKGPKTGGFKPSPQPNS